jgi:hypothetical protein
MVIRSNTAIYPSNAFRGEIDLRSELAKTLHGSSFETAKGKPILIRTMRRDVTGTKLPCTCIDRFSREPDGDTLCPYCLGEGWYWDEAWAIGYSKVILGPTSGTIQETQATSGTQKIPGVIFFIEWHEDFTLDDKIIEVALDKDGLVSIPNKRTAVYRINTLVPYRADNGRLEYWQVSCKQEAVKFFNGR